MDGSHPGRKLDKEGPAQPRPRDFISTICAGARENVLGEVDRGFYHFMRNLTRRANVHRGARVVAGARETGRRPVQSSQG